MRDSTAAHNFTSNITDKLRPLLESKSAQFFQREQMFNKLYNTVMLKELVSSWEKSLSQSEDISPNMVKKSNILLKFLTDDLFLQVLKLRNTVFGKKISEGRGIIQLTLIEEKTLRFVGRYILYSLRKKMKESSTSKAILTVIVSWDANREDNLTDCGFMEYTKEWVEKVNR